jgi:threonine/homoserine/homoserine lactone efflux protein
MITLHFIGTIALYAFVTSITPGPNNTMLIASGVNFGLRASLPHMWGISIGFSLMLFAVGMGVGGLFLGFPASYRAVQIIGAAYMLYLAWKIANASAPTTSQRQAAKPFSFIQAAAFQWVNPKAWVLAIGVASTYLPREGYFASLLAACIVFAIVNFPCIAVWAGTGELLRERLKDPKLLRAFNLTMAALLVISLYPMLTTSLHGNNH